MKAVLGGIKNLGKNLNQAHPQFNLHPLTPAKVTISTI